MGKKSKEQVVEASVPTWTLVSPCPKCGAPIYEWRASKDGMPAATRMCHRGCKFAPPERSASVTGYPYQ